MSKFVLQYDVNKSVSFLHIVNFLVSRKIMSLEEARGIYRKFNVGEDVVLYIPDDQAPAFRSYLQSINCKFE